MVIFTAQYPRKIDEYVSIKTENGWIKEHIFVVEQFLGRELKEDECVHHIDFNKQNNEIENLCLFTKSQHAHFHRQIKQFKLTTPRKLEVYNNIIKVKLRSLK